MNRIINNFKTSFKKYRKNFIFHTILILWLVFTLSCSWPVIYPSQLTATAVSSELGAGISTTTDFLSSVIVDTPTPNTPAYTTPTTMQVSPTPTETFAVITPDFYANSPLLYYTQSGDTLPAIAVRFDVEAEQITSPDYDIPPASLLVPNKLLIIPNTLSITSESTILMPDSEVVYSPSAIGFGISSYVDDTNGYLKSYKEYLSSGWYTGSEIVNRVAIENSINPRLLLALLEYQSNWVFGQPRTLAETDYPLGYRVYKNKGLYRQLSWAVQQLSLGYYGWRAGLVTELNFPNKESIRLAPSLNAGTVSVQYLFSALYDLSDWNNILYSQEGFITLYEEMFDNPWLRAQSVEPLYPPNLIQPQLELPFEEGKTWSMTGGPHSAWGKEGALAALDYAPTAMEHGCVESFDWVVASASGLVVRTDTGLIMLDLDGDGHEQTGWNILYLHVATDGRVKEGEWVNVNDRIGHPSCEGGVATGTHVHVARKFNGEWILADGPLPFILSGWTAYAGDSPYLGGMTNGDKIVSASTSGSYESLIIRPKNSQ